MPIRFDNCPLCGSTDFSKPKIINCSTHPLYVEAIPAHKEWVKCEDCAHVFASAYFTTDEQDAIFKKVMVAQKVGTNPEMARHLSAAVIEKTGVDGGSWLDVGFGNGALLETALEFGFSPVGLELRHTGTLSPEIEAFYCAIEDFRTDRRFDVISMMDV